MNNQDSHYQRGTGEQVTYQRRKSVSRRLRMLDAVMVTLFVRQLGGPVPSVG